MTGDDRGPLYRALCCVRAMESVSVHSYRVGQWLVKPASEGEPSMTADSRQLDSGGVSETLAALTLAQARVSASATGTMRPEHAAAAVEDVVCGSATSAEPPIETAVKQAAGDLSREEPPVSVDAVASQHSGSAQTQEAAEEVPMGNEPGKVASELASAAEERASDFYDAQSEVLPAETKGEHPPPPGDEAEAGGGGMSAVVNAVACAAERAAAAIGLVSKGE